MEGLHRDAARRSHGSPLRPAPPSCDADVGQFERIAAGVDADYDPLPAAERNRCLELHAQAAVTLLDVYKEIAGCDTVSLAEGLTALHDSLVGSEDKDDGLIASYARALTHLPHMGSAGRPEEALAEAFAALDTFVFTWLRVQVAALALLEGVESRAFAGEAQASFATVVETFATRAEELRPGEVPARPMVRAGDQEEASSWGRRHAVRLPREGQLDLRGRWRTGCNRQHQAGEQPQSGRSPQDVQSMPIRMLNRMNRKGSLFMLHPNPVYPVQQPSLFPKGVCSDLLRSYRRSK